MINFIPVNEPFFGGNEKKYLTECIDTGWVSSEGTFVKEFEKQFSNRLQRDYGIAVASGTAALEIAIRVLGIGSGDEVILPDFTIISCAAAIIKVGAIPVVVDCDPETWNMNVSQIEAKITAKTAAIMAVHIYGLPVDLDPVIDLCKSYNLKLIEDAAEAIGLQYKGRECGSFGDVSIVSFYANKHVTTGEGGMVLTNDKQLDAHARSLRNLCFIPSKRFVHYEIGFNYRMTNIQAAIGLAQLEKLDQTIHTKRAIGNYYNHQLCSVKEIQTPLTKTSYADNIYWVFGIVLKDHRTAQTITTELTKRGIGTRPFFYPMHKQPALRKMGFFKSVTCPVSDQISEKGFYLPSGVALKPDQIDHICLNLREVLDETI